MPLTGSNIYINAKPDLLFAFIIKKWQAIACQAIQEKGVFSVALSGGKTPIPFYKKLATGRFKLPWQNTHIFLTDERFLPLNHRDSNFYNLKKHLLRSLNIPLDNIHFVDTKKITAQAAASHHAAALKNFFKTSGKSLPKFDLIMLGIGEDGHVASLFPKHPALTEKRKWVISAQDAQHKYARISLTLPVINHAAQIIFLVTGSKKAKLIKEVIRDKNKNLPASLVNLKSTRAIFVLDDKAARYLA